MLKIQLYAQTDPGLVREQNEDNFCIHRRFKPKDKPGDACSFRTGHETIAAVFDGIGGEAHGEMASFIAAKTMARFDGTVPEDDWNMILEAINDRINDFSDHFKCNAGCTAAILHYQDGNVEICNLGDSRIYLLRDGTLTQLSRDHTELQLALDMKLPNFDLQTSCIKKGQLTKCLGVREQKLDPYICSGIEVRESDLLLICSDGLTDMVKDARICEIMRTYDRGELAERLVREALDNGGKDNVTVVIAAFAEKRSLFQSLLPHISML